MLIYTHTSFNNDAYLFMPRFHNLSSNFWQNYKRHHDQLKTIDELREHFMGQKFENSLSRNILIFQNLSFSSHKQCKGNNRIEL